VLPAQRHQAQAEGWMNGDVLSWAIIIGISWRAQCVEKEALAGWEAVSRLSP
jgi:hypothetical protein